MLMPVAALMIMRTGTISTKLMSMLSDPAHAVSGATPPSMLRQRSESKFGVQKPSASEPGRVSSS